jgi:LmbE family N-acetylglucosaminyl deacetylase
MEGTIMNEHAPSQSGSPAGLSRRRFLTAAAAEGLAVSGSAGAALSGGREETMEQAPVKTPLSVVCVGAHPDDPEESSFGTLARYAEAGHRVTILYLTRGERGIQGKSLAEAAAIRTAEAEAACRIIGAKAVFAGQIDGDTEANRKRTEAFRSLLYALQPDVVFTHWPIDTHSDHQVASLLTLRAYLSAPRPFRLYYFEVESGEQALGFTPMVYVDITATRAKKQAALFSHKSQHGEAIYHRHHELIERFRGREIGTEAAEAFFPLARDQKNGGLPGLT